LGVHEIFIAV